MLGDLSPSVAAKQWPPLWSALGHNGSELGTFKGAYALPWLRPNYVEVARLAKRDPGPRAARDLSGPGGLLARTYTNGANEPEREFVG